jgi:uncharacterized protein YdeI (YjbR/CyaY-like superfamily)
MPAKPVPDDAKVIAFCDAAEFEAWLAEHVNHTAGVWLKIAKKGSGIASLTDDEAVDVGLCYGWIPASARDSMNCITYKSTFPAVLGAAGHR